MENKQKFIEHINSGYATKGDSIYMGAAMLDGKPLPEARVQIPLKTLNRHGLIAGATGTGKTKTLQILAENMSEKGIPVLMMDVKGDLSGIAQPAEPNERLVARHNVLNYAFTPGASPVEILSLSEQPGVRLRATGTEFGPVLLAKILDVSETQAGMLAIIFQ
jgi:DNA helicase HerA-like ATPase